ncbi:DUF1294 domain-containing protein [Youngiibacter multivorans]|uniref:Uncharacterized membrane protein YsdA (DUF1294 family) n=1 Tax=Youngiibacter multivorans TaxID=937251 RepID=A0ABS4G0K7_9CLOT|nr:DUF1294 domain-containing protein [Youngiibacter multivorans]MBP1918085.1 uncharacterized membrane protein YsdA (DUF1294 family) [Youngiibacter multivorans]
MDFTTILRVAFLAINAIGLIVMFWDKRKARRREWRIPENTLFLIAGIGGAFGVLFGMSLARHKTRHLKFQLGIPVLAFAWALILMKTGLFKI